MSIAATFDGGRTKDLPDRGAEGAIPPGDREDPHEDNTYGLPNGTPIARAYRRFLRRIKREVLGTLPTIGAPVRILDPDLTDWLNPMETAMTPLLSAYWDEAGKETRARLGLDPDEWRVVDPHLHAAIEQQSHAFCQGTLATTSETVGDAYRKLSAELVAGLVTEGESIPELAKRVRSVFHGLSCEHSVMIARTESSRAVHAASELSAKESGVVSGKVWLLSSNACPLCHRLAEASKANPIPLGGEFANVGSNPVYSSIRMPPGHPHCLLPETPIVAPGRVAGIMAHYDGPVVRLRFSEGSDVTVTPNHMLLTPTGFARAKDLVEGDDVIKCPLPETPSGGNPDHHGGPTRVDQVVKTLSESGGMATSLVPVSPEYLHGDAGFCEGDIHVVSPDGLLLNDVNPLAPQPPGELCFPGADVPGGSFDCGGDLAAVLIALRDATDGGVRVLRERKSLLWAHSRHADQVGLSYGPDGHVVLNQSPTHRRAGDTEPSGDGEFGFTQGISGDDRPVIDLEPVRLLPGIGSDLDTGFDEAVADGRRADTKGLRDVIDRFPGSIATCKVIGIQIDHYAGPVYDVETVTSLYVIGNGVASSNCRCSVTYRLTPEYQALVDANPPETYQPGPLGPEPREVTKKSFRRKFNPNHDAAGRFSTGHGGGHVRVGNHPESGVPADLDPGAPGLTIGQARKRTADNIEKAVARAVGGEWKTGNEPADAAVAKPGGGLHQIEVKSKTFGAKESLSVHDAALENKVNDQIANPKNTWHSVMVDRRDTSEGGAHAGSYSGHDLYYKRAAGAYPVSQMHKVKDLAELNRLIAMPAHRLPKAARGEFPKGEALKELRVRAAKERAYNNARSKASKAAKRAAGVDPYKPRG